MTFEERQVVTQSWVKKFAHAYLACYLIWLFGALLGAFNWPGMGWTFYAGMEFEYLTWVRVRPWIHKRRTENKYATIRKVGDNE